MAGGDLRNIDVQLLNQDTVQHIHNLVVSLNQQTCIPTHSSTLSCEINVLGADSNCVFLLRLSLSWLAEVGRRKGEGGVGRGQLLYTDKGVEECLENMYMCKEKKYKLFLLDRCSVKIAILYPICKSLRSYS